jgi:hypothetical protein
MAGECKKNPGTMAGIINFFMLYGNFYLFSVFPATGG